MRKTLNIDDLKKIGQELEVFKENFSKSYPARAQNNIEGVQSQNNFNPSLVDNFRGAFIEEEKIAEEENSSADQLARAHGPL